MGSEIMPYVMRTVIAGRTRETKKMYTGRVHTKGAHREPNSEKTSEAQHKINEAVAEEKLRWLLNANFVRGDFHTVLHYWVRPTLEQAEKDKSKFLRILREHCHRSGIRWKFVACTETKHAPHHHIIMPQVDISTLQELWERVVGTAGNVTVKPLDRRDNHGKLAHYLIKETSKAVRRYREAGLRYKRFTSARGMERPEAKYKVVSASSWAKEPKNHKGWALWQDDNGTTVKTGIHEVTGYAWQEYMEVWLGDDPPPGQKIRRRMIA